MKNKLKLFIFSILGAFLGLIALNLGTEKVKADEVYLNVKDKSYTLPVTIYLCEYDFQKDYSMYKETYNFYSATRGAISIPGKHTITNSNDLSTFFTHANDTFCYLIEQDTFDIVDDENDALSINYFIISYDNSLFNSDTQLDYRKSKIYEDYPRILNVFVPDTLVLEESDLYLGPRQTPLIRSEETYFITNYDNPITVNQIKSNLTAIDNEDGDLTNQIIILTDNYTSANPKTPGEYEIVFQVTDTSDNTSTLSVKVKVEDITPPYATALGQLTFPTGTTLTTNEVKNMITPHDNYSTTSYLKAHMTCVKDTWTENKSVPGVYEIVFSIVDEAGNKTFFAVSIKVIDSQKPSISGSNDYTKSITADLPIGKIMQSLTATDNVDGNISNYITVVDDTYTGNENTVGEYYVDFRVSDSSGNKSDLFRVSITVTDDVMPIFYVNNSFINVTDFQAMTHQDIIDFLIETEAIRDNPTTVSFIYDEYSNNYDKEGLYQVSLKVNYANNESEIVNLNINVSGNEEKEEKLNWFQRVLSFFKKIFISIRDFVLKLFSYIKKAF